MILTPELPESLAHNLGRDGRRECCSRIAVPQVMKSDGGEAGPFGEPDEPLVHPAGRYEVSIFPGEHESAASIRRSPGETLLCLTSTMRSKGSNRGGVQRERSSPRVRLRLPERRHIAHHGQRLANRQPTFAHIDEIPPGLATLPDVPSHDGVVSRRSGRNQGLLLPGPVRPESGEDSGKSLLRLPCRNSMSRRSSRSRTRPARHMAAYRRAHHASDLGKRAERTRG